MVILGIFSGIYAGLVAGIWTNYADHKSGFCKYSMWTCKGSWAATLFAAAMSGLVCGFVGYLLQAYYLN